jgi:hypothetical protein
MPREKLGEILIKAGLLDELGLQRALNEQQRWGGQIGRYLVELGLITEETLVRALSTQFKLPAVTLDPSRLSIAVGRMVPKEICERNGLICFRADLKSRFVDVALSDPSNLAAVDDVRVATKCNVRPHIAAPTIIDKAISFVFYGDPADSATGWADIDLSPGSAMRIDSRAGSSAPAEYSPGAAASAAPAAPAAAAAPPRPPGRVRVSSQAPGVFDPAATATALPRVEVRNPGAAARPGDAPMLDLEVRSGLTPPPSPGPGVRPPPPQTGDSFHITLEVPQVDRAALARAKPGPEDRLATLEATLTRNNALLQTLLDVLLRRGLISREELQRIIASGG